MLKPISNFDSKMWRITLFLLGIVVASLTGSSFLIFFSGFGAIQALIETPTKVAAAIGFIAVIMGTLSLLPALFVTVTCSKRAHNGPLPYVLTGAATGIVSPSVLIGPHIFFIAFLGIIGAGSAYVFWTIAVYSHARIRAR